MPYKVALVGVAGLSLLASACGSGASPTNPDPTPIYLGQDTNVGRIYDVTLERSVRINAECLDQHLGKLIGGGDEVAFAIPSMNGDELRGIRIYPSPRLKEQEMRAAIDELVNDCRK